MGSRDARKEVRTTRLKPARVPTPAFRDLTHKSIGRRVFGDLESTRRDHRSYSDVTTTIPSLHLDVTSSVGSSEVRYRTLLSPGAGKVSLDCRPDRLSQPGIQETLYGATPQHCDTYIAQELLTRRATEDLSEGGLIRWVLREKNAAEEAVPPFSKNQEKQLI